MSDNNNDNNNNGDDKKNQKPEEEKKIIKKIDADGRSLHVARGISDKDARERHDELFQKLTTTTSSTPNKEQNKDDNNNNNEQEQEITTYRDEIVPVNELMLNKKKKKKTTSFLEDGVTKAEDEFGMLRNRRNRNYKAGRNKKVEARLDIQDMKRLEATMGKIDAAAVLATHTAGMMEAENDMEHTTKLTQVQLKRLLYKNKDPTAQHIYDLTLPAYNGPYGYQYDRSGRYGCMYGTGNAGEGHIAITDCLSTTLQTEFYVRDKIRDVSFLHNNSLLGVAQKNNVYIYDNTGTEIHKLDKHIDPFKLQYLPYHYLLASIGRTGHLKYQDISTGDLVVEPYQNGKL